MAFPLGEEGLCIGIDAESGICVDDEPIPSNHAQIVYNSGDYVLCENDSLNGTFVNGARIQTQILCHNDQISLGSYQFLVDLEGAPTELNLPASEPDHPDGKTGVDDRLIPVDSVQERRALEMRMEPASPPVYPENQFYSKKVVLCLGIGALILILVLAVFSLDMVLKNKNNLLEIGRIQIVDLRRFNQSNEVQIQKLREDLTQSSIALNRANEDLKKLEAKRLSLEKQNTQNLKDLQKTTQDLKVATEKIAVLNKTKTEPAKTANEELKKKEIQFSAREQVASRLEPIPYLGAVEIPSKISMLQDTTVTVMQNLPGGRNLTIKRGQSFPVVRAEPDLVVVDLAGEKIRIARKNTDFNSALDAANLSRKKENERLYNERELLVDQMVEAEAKAIEHEKQEKEPLMKSKVLVKMRVQGFVAGGVLAQKTDEPGVVMALLTGVDIKKMAIGDPWQGDAFPMGVFIRPGTEQKCRHYTADWKEFSAFVKSGSQQDPVCRQVKELV